MQSSSVLIVPASTSQSIEQKSTFIILPNFIPLGSTVNKSGVRPVKKERLIKPNLRPKPDNGPKVDLVFPAKRRKSRSGNQNKKQRFDSAVVKQEKLDSVTRQVEPICKTEFSQKIFGELSGYLYLVYLG